jgi:hypothetical protein
VRKESRANHGQDNTVDVVLSGAFDRAKVKFTRKRILIGLLLAVVVMATPFAWRASRERLNSIPARGGELFKMSPIPTAHYLQNDPAWKDDTIGGSGERLGRVGCAVASLAMAFDHYGVKATPKDLNNFLKTSEGYTLRGWLKWNAISKFADGKVTMAYIGPATHARMDEALRQQQPIIVKVFINRVIPHWVLVVGKEGDDYLMRDPLDESKSVKRLSGYESKIYAMRTLKPSR